MCVCVCVCVCMYTYSEIAGFIYKDIDTLIFVIIVKYKGVLQVLYMHLIYSTCNMDVIYDTLYPKGVD